MISSDGTGTVTIILSVEDIKRCCSNTDHHRPGMEEFAQPAALCDFTSDETVGKHEKATAELVRTPVN